ncbi:MAG: response regulator transcription factor, partial [Planctomycetes bacterium]|nr:response regulator transcription factor [Planctomycetota bacterium]
LMLPGRGGLEILRALRAASLATPVLLLTARGEEHDKVLGLELGADDYVTKPFGIRELVARVRAMLRRTALTESVPLRQFRIGAAEIDLEAFQVEVDGQVQRLSKKEAAMLALLFRNAGKAVSRSAFLDEVWGSDRFVSTRTVDTHVLNLRQKIEPDPAAPVFLVTVHGIGYRLEPGGGGCA